MWWILFGYEKFFVLIALLFIFSFSELYGSGGIWDKVTENRKFGKIGARVDGQIIHIMNILIHLLLNLVK